MGLDKSIFSDLYISINSLIHAKLEVFFCQVYNSMNGKSSLLYTHCGDTNPAPINSSENKMMVHFKSDHDINGKGFHAVYVTRGQ